MSTYIPAKENIDILKILELVKDLFSHVDWGVRVQLGEQNGVQFYDKASSLRFSIINPLKLYFSIDDSEGTIFELDNLETVSIQEKLIESKSIYNLILPSVENLLNLIREEFPTLTWSIKNFNLNKQYVCFTSTEYIDIELTLKEIKLFKHNLSVKIPLHNNISLDNLKSKIQEGKNHLVLMSRFDATVEGDFPYTPRPTYNII